MQIYLAGRIHGISYKEATEWRNDLKHRLKYTEINILDPMQGKDKLEGCENIPASVAHYANDEIFERAIADVLASDYVIANLNSGTSFGTAFECGVAWAKGISIIYLANQDHPLLQHPFITETAKYIYFDVSNLAAYLGLTHYRELQGNV